MRIKILHWTSHFGLLIPMKTGVLWQHQTDGCMCNQIYIEGIFVPLDEPFRWDEKKNKSIDYLDLLATSNYEHREKSVEKLWGKINEQLDFVYEDIKAPTKQPDNQEGIKWIKITKIKYPKKGYFGWKDDCKSLDRKYKSLINKKIALIYPNCD